MKARVWLAVSILLVADQYDPWWALSLFIVDGALSYIGGFYSAWRRDRAGTTEE